MNAQKIKEMIENIPYCGNDYESDAYRMSTISISCDRRIQLIRNSNYFPAETVAMVDTRKQELNSGVNAILIGSLIHEYLESKLDVSSEQEVTIKYPIPFVGHYDLLFDIDGVSVVADIKTIGAYGEKYIPKDSHIDQLHAYMHALGIYHGVLIYISRNNGKVYTFDINYDAVRWKKVVTRFEKIRDAEEQRILLPAVQPNRGGFPCAYCEWRYVCHPMVCEECHIHGLSQ